MHTPPLAYKCTSGLPGAVPCSQAHRCRTSSCPVRSGRTGPWPAARRASWPLSGPSRSAEASRRAFPRRPDSRTSMASVVHPKGRSLPSQDCIRKHGQDRSNNPGASCHDASSVRRPTWKWSSCPKRTDFGRALWAAAIAERRYHSYRCATKRYRQKYCFFGTTILLRRRPPTMKISPN